MVMVCTWASRGSASRAAIWVASAVVVPSSPVTWPWTAPVASTSREMLPAGRPPLRSPSFGPSGLLGSPGPCGRLLGGPHRVAELVVQIAGEDPPHQQGGYRRQQHRDRGHDQGDADDELPV